MKKSVSEKILEAYSDLIKAVICEEEILVVRTGDVKRIETAINSLSLQSERYERYINILKLRFGLDGEGIRTQKRVGDEFKICPCRVAQLEKNALELLCKLEGRMFRRFSKKEFQSSARHQRLRLLKRKPKLIVELSITRRSYICLKAAGIVNIADLIKKTGNDLLELRGFGENSLADVRSALKVIDMRLSGE